MGEASRDARGRFEPGHSGNPAGKRPGTLNRATVLARALGGDMVAARFVLARIDPRPRGPTVELDLAVDAPLAERFDAVLAALAAGRITPDEALTLARFLERHGRVTCGEDRPRAARPTEPVAPAPAPEPAPEPPAVPADEAAAAPAAAAVPSVAATAVVVARMAEISAGAPAALLHFPSVLPSTPADGGPAPPPSASRRRAAALARAGAG